MRLILYPLLILMTLSGFYQLLNYSSINLSYTNAVAVNATGNQTLNSVQSQLTQQGTTGVFDVNMVTGLIALIIGLVAVGVVAGIHVLGSGLSPYSVQLIHKSCVYYGLWGVFSSLSFVVFSSIPVFGLFLWLGLTLIYSIGFFGTLNEGRGDD